MSTAVVDLSGFDPNKKPNTDGPRRNVKLTPASEIGVRPVFWVWADRLATGTLGLLAGPPGVGKSTLAYWLAARLTRGQLAGEYYGTPRSVLVAATEDSWEHTIVPRLMAAKADLTAVYRVDVVTEDDLTVSLSMPADLSQVEAAAHDVGAAMMLLDPLMSRLNAKLDTHKDADVRIALEPLVAVADRAHMAILGLIHHNKGGSSDPLNLVMASTGFTAVARSVHTCIKDPDDETGERRLFGTPKNNLGRIDLPTLVYGIAGHHVASTPEGEIWTGRLNWLGEIDGTIADAMRRGAGSDEERSAVQEAAEWLTDYLLLNGGTVDSADAKKDGAKAGHSQDSLKRARRRLGIEARPEGFPRRSMWVRGAPDTPELSSAGQYAEDAAGDPSLSSGSSPESQWEQPLGRHTPALTGQGSTKETPTTPKSPIDPTLSSGAVGARFSPPARVAPTGQPEDDDEPPEHEWEPTLCRVCDQPVDPSIDTSTHPACDPWRTA